MTKVLITAPLDSELAPLRQAVKNEKLPFDITFLTLGVGPKKSVKTLENYLKDHPVWDFVLVVGLAGSLSVDLKRGEVVTPVSVTNGIQTYSAFFAQDSTLKQVPFLTVNRILKSAEKSEALQKNPDLKVVDMESFGLAETLSRRQIPFKILRGILDEKDTVFPDFRWIFSDKQAHDALPFLIYAVMHPKKAISVLSFKRDMRRCLKKLVDSVVRFLKSELE